MRTRSLPFAVLLGLTFYVTTERALPAEKADAESIGKLVARLGNDSFSEREEASKALDEIGVPALDALRKAATSGDLEVQRRARDLVQRIERRAAMEQITKPKIVHLVLDNVPVPEAVADLAKKSGFEVLLGGEQGKLAERRITLDTGDVPFWQALDLLCDKAGLVEDERPNAAKGKGKDAANVDEKGKGDTPVKGKRKPLQPVPIPPGDGNDFVEVMPPGVRPPMVGVSKTIVLVEGKTKALPTHYAGAFRIRSLPADHPQAIQLRNHSQTAAVVEVRAEPGRQWGGIRKINIEKAVDDQGQELAEIESQVNDPNMPFVPGGFGGFGGLQVFPGGIPVEVAPDGTPMGNAQGPSRLPVLLKRAEKPSKSLKELKGSISTQVQDDIKPLIQIDNILKATGQKVKGENGGSINVQDFSPMAKTGKYRLRIQIELPEDTENAEADGVIWMQQGGGVMVRGRVGRGDPILAGLSLVDAKGEKFQAIASNSNFQMINNVVTRVITITYQPQQGQGDPDKLIFVHARPTKIDIPFVLKDVPLP